MSSHVETALVQEALQMALGRRRPAAGLIHHSDRGSQYACSAYQAVLVAHGIRCRMSRKGDCLDNAVAERFFGRLKGERMALQPYAGRQEAREEVIEYIEMFYNSKRLHSYLGYRRLTAFEESTTAASLRVRFSLTTTCPFLLRSRFPQVSGVFPVPHSHAYP